MTDRMPPADLARKRRLVWTTGGALLVASAVIGLSQTTAPGTSGLTGWMKVVLFAVAVVLFAVGNRGIGSVTALRPLGTSALIALALWPFLVDVFWRLVPNAFMMSDAAPYVGTGAQVIELALALIAVMQIARVGAVPKPWSWAPAAALAVIVACRVLGMLLFLGLQDQGMLIALLGLTSLIESIVVVSLGVLAIVLAMRPAGERTVAVFPAE